MPVGRTTKPASHGEKTYDYVKAGMEKPRYPCTHPGCTYSTLQEYRLESHYKSVHLGIKDQICPVCGLKTTEACALSRHMNLKHREYLVKMCRMESNAPILPPIQDAVPVSSQRSLPSLRSTIASLQIPRLPPRGVPLPGHPMPAPPIPSMVSPVRPAKTTAVRSANAFPPVEYNSGDRSVKATRREIEPTRSVVHGRNPPQSSSGPRNQGYDSAVTGESWNLYDALVMVPNVPPYTNRGQPSSRS